MSGFDADWLALREPADRAARDGGLVALLAAHLERPAKKPASLLDIGCGTGSTWRSLHAALPASTRWQLLDYDPLLLAAAEQRIGPDAGVLFRRHDLNDLAGLPLQGVDAVTASALFDLCSEDFCRKFVARLAEHRCALYAALSYDGTTAWLPAHPLDGRALADFNRHQRTDKGFGPALGPDATEVLRTELEAAGYTVHIADSCWSMGPDQAALQLAFLNGFETPLREIGGLSSAEVDDWLSFRRAHTLEAATSCRVGHLDLLALPG